MPKKEFPIGMEAMGKGTKMALLFMVAHPASPGGRLSIIISAVIKAKQQPVQRQSAAS